MAEPGWYPDPEGVPGRLRYWDGGRWTADTLDERRRRNRLIAFLGTLLVLAMVVTIVVVIMVRADRGVVPDTRPPAAPSSGWNDSSPTVSASPTPTPRHPSPSRAPSASHGSPRVERPSARCPAGEPRQAVKHRRDGRVHGGQLSYRPVSGHGFGKPRVDDHYGWWYDEHGQTAAIGSGPATGRHARLAVGSVAIQAGFRSVQQAAHSSLQCLISTDDYAAFTGKHLLHSKKIIVDGQRSWELDADIGVRNRRGADTGDRVRLIVVDAGAPGSYSIFVGVAPIDDDNYQKIIAGAIATLEVGN